MKKLDKNKVKKVYDFVKANAVEWEHTIELCKGVQAELVYSTYLENGEWNASIDHQEFILSEGAQEVMDLCKFDIAEDFDFFNSEPDWLGLYKLDEQLVDLCERADLNDDDRGWFDVGIWDDLDSFEEIFARIEAHYQVNQKIAEVVLNSSYTAVIDKETDTVRVGCQTFPIGKVRAIVAAYDDL